MTLEEIMEITDKLRASDRDDLWSSLSAMIRSSAAEDKLTDRGREKLTAICEETLEALSKAPKSQEKIDAALKLKGSIDEETAEHMRKTMEESRGRKVQLPASCHPIGKPPGCEKGFCSNCKENRGRAPWLKDPKDADLDARIQFGKHHGGKNILVTIQEAEDMQSIRRIRWELGERLRDYRDGRKESYDSYDPLDSQERHDKDELAAFINGLDAAIEILTGERPGGVIKIPKARHMIPCKNHALDSTQEVVKALQGILIIMSKNHTQKCQKFQDYQKSIGELQDWIREYIGVIDED